MHAMMRCTFAMGLLLSCLLAHVANRCMQQRVACTFSTALINRVSCGRQASMLDGCAGAQALTRKLSEAALGLGGKQHHAIMPPVEKPPSACDEAHNMTLPEASTLSGGRSSVLRPQVTLRPLPQAADSPMLKQQASLCTTGQPASLTWACT